MGPVVASFFTLACVVVFFCFFFNDTATTEIYTLSLHDALPIYLAGKRDVPVDYQENIFAGLRMQTKAQHQQQHEAHCVNISSLESGCGAGSSVHDHQAIAFSPIPLSESAPPGPLVIIHTKHPGAWEMKLFYATELKFDSTPGRAAGRHWRGNENESRGAPGKLWTSISSTRSWKSSG